MVGIFSRSVLDGTVSRVLVDFGCSTVALGAESGRLGSCGERDTLFRDFGRGTVAERAP